MNFPCYESGQAITAGTSSATAALAGTAQKVNASKDVLIWNPGPNLVHVRAGASDVVADATCAPVPPGSMWVYAKGNATHIATFAIGGAQSILVLMGAWD